jgi:hypothetical protein
MSEFTRCNWHTVEDIKRRAAKRGMEVTLVPEPLAGFERGVHAYVHKPGQAPKSGEHHGWFAAVGTECEC